MRVTTKDLAQMCGVSRTTVLRALHDTGRINPETKQKILDKALEIGYEPDLVARSLVSGKSGMIGVVVVDLRNQYFPMIIDGIERRVKEDGFILNIMLHEDDKQIEEKLIRTLVGYRIEGIIINPINKGQKFYDIVKNLQVPYCVLGVDEFEECPCIGIDECAAAADATRHILEKGYRDIVFVAPPLYDEDGEYNLGHHKRMEGYQNVMRASGLGEHVIYGEDYVQQTLEYIQGKETEKVAFLCSGAVFTLTVIQAMSKNGYELLKDYGIMGFDRFSFFENLDWEVSTVDNQVDLMGRLAGEMLIKQIREEKIEKRQIVPHKIIEGKTL